MKRNSFQFCFPTSRLCSVHVYNIIVCSINLLRPSLLMTAFPRVVARSFDFQILRIALALRSLPNENLVYRKHEYKRSILQCLKRCVRARARLIPLMVIVLLMSVRPIFAPKTASEFFNVHADANRIRQVGLSLGQKTNE